ncbi:hypothetical protein MUL_5049 [Mycobacterium ulcerans Agy99]|uniref:Uncharacterized protein n=1 Tax=Mycobacterium ulcerans (strain Agy99) TaxID=362242 RepID=A0PX48_MYCUA|nr:hypothetical protein MUL_5049 [Mycobacterium ulcerans Agy99]
MREFASVYLDAPGCPGDGPHKAIHPALHRMAIATAVYRRLDKWGRRRAVSAESELTRRRTVVMLPPIDKGVKGRS